MEDLFIIAKTPKQFNYLLTRAQMNKLWCVSNITLELSNSNCWCCTQQLKQLVLSLCAIAWIKHETIILRTCTDIPWDLIYSDINQDSGNLAAVGTNCKCDKEILGGDEMTWELVTQTYIPVRIWSVYLCILFYINYISINFMQF